MLAELRFEVALHALGCDRVVFRDCAQALGGADTGDRTMQKVDVPRLALRETLALPLDFLGDRLEDPEGFPLRVGPVRKGPRRDPGTTDDAP
jgi:hypothetical protein